MKKDAQAEGPTLEERVSRIEEAIGLSPETFENPPADAIPGEPLMQHELYAPGEPEAA